MSRSQLHTRRPALTSSLAIAAALSFAPQVRAQSFDASSTLLAGSATVTTGTNTTTITVNSPTAVIQWSPNDTTSGTINFQPAGTTALFQGTATSGNFAVLNNVVPTSTSQLIQFNGTVQSQLQGGTPGGTVFFYSPAGIIVGPSATIDVGNLGLTTSPIAYDSQGEFRTFDAVTGAPKVVFGQAQAGSFVNVAQGAQVFAGYQGGNPFTDGSYVAMVAPSVHVGGTIHVDGSAALVAADAATVTFSPDGLFSISADVPTSAAGTVLSVDPNGSIVGPAASSTGVHGIYLVTAPRNTLISMAISGGQPLGFDVAGAADVVGNRVVLSGGFNVVSGVADETARIGGTGQVDGVINNAAITSRTDLVSTGAAMVIGNDSNAPTTFASNLTMHGLVSSGINVFTGGSVSVAGNLDLRAIDPASISGFSGNALAGNASINVFGTGSQVNLNGTVNTVAASATGGSALTSGATAGDGRGGSAFVRASQGGTIIVAGDLTVTADGFGGQVLSSGAGGGMGIGGQASIQAFTGNSTVSIGGNATISASGIGSDCTDPTCTTGGGMGQGGSASISSIPADTIPSMGSVITIGGSASLNATGTGGAGAVVAGGAGKGGAASVTADNGNQVVAGALFVTAGGQGGSATGPGIKAGNANGGSAIISATQGGQITITNPFGAAQTDASAFGGGGFVSRTNPGDSNGGDAVGGTAQVSTQGGTITGAFDVRAEASGGGGSIFGGTSTATGGLGRGGTAFVSVSKDAQGRTGTISSNIVEIYANAFGGDGFNAGTATGGSTFVDVSGGSLMQLSGDLRLEARANGGIGFSNPATFLATGGATSVIASSGGQILVAGDARFNSTGTGALTEGLSSYGASGKGGTVNLAVSDGNAIIDIGTSLFAIAEGVGFGGGGCATTGCIDAGNGMGGSVFIDARSGSTTPGGGSQILVGSSGSGGASISAQGFGSSGQTSNGGTGTGGFIGVTASTTSGSPSANAITFFTQTELKVDGTGGDQFGTATTTQPLSGGMGKGGTVSIGPNGLNGQITAAASLTVTADGFGGAGSVETGSGASGGAAMGGNAVIQANSVGGSATFGGSVLVSANATGGNAFIPATTGIGGAATGGTARINASTSTAGTGGSMAFGGPLTVSTLATGGTGLNGGAGTGGTSLVVAGNGTIAGGSVAIDSSGIGGDGLASTDPVTGAVVVGNGGNGTGGASNLQAFTGAAATGFAKGSITFDSAELDSNGVGGAGGDAFSAAGPVNGGNGGSGAGGQNLALADAGNGSLSINGSVLSFAVGSGGRGGNGSNSPAGDGGNGGTGGVGTGGGSQIGTRSGIATATALGQSQFGDIQMVVNGQGGRGGDGGNPTASTGSFVAGLGGTGGAAFDGGASLLVRGSPVTVTGGPSSTGGVSIFADAFGGDGGNGRTQGAGGNATVGGNGGFAVLVTNRNAVPTQGGLLDTSAVSVTGRAKATGGAGSTQGQAILLDQPQQFTVINSRVNASSISLTSIGQPGAPTAPATALVEAPIALTNSTVNITNTLQFSSGGAISLSLNNSALNVQNATLAGSDFVLPATAPTAIGTFTITSGPIAGFHVQTGNNLFAYANFVFPFDVSFVLPGSLRFNNVSGGNALTVNAGGSIQLGNLDLGDINLTSAAMSLGSINAAGDVTLTSRTNGDISTGTIATTASVVTDTTGIVTITAGGALTTGAITSANDLIDIFAVGNLQSGNLSAASDVFVGTAAGTITTGTMGSSSGSVNVSANGGDVTLGAINAAQFVGIGGAGNLNLSAISSGLSTFLGANGTINASGLITAGTAVVATAGGSIFVQDVTGGTAQATQSSGNFDVQLVAGNQIGVGKVTTPSLALISAGFTIGAGSITARDALVLGNGATTISGAINTTGQVYFANSSMTSLGGTPGSGYNANAVFSTAPVRLGGPIVLNGAISAPLGFTAATTNDFTAGAIPVTNGALLIDAGGKVTTGDLAISGNAVVRGSGAIKVGQVSSGNLLLLGGSTIDTLSLTANRVLLAGENAYAFGVTGGAYDINPVFANVGFSTLAQYRAPGAITVTGPINALFVRGATAQGFTTGDVTLPAGLGVNAGGLISVGSIVAAFGVGLISDTDIATGDVNVGLTLTSGQPGALDGISMNAGGKITAGNVSVLNGIGFTAGTSISSGSLTAGGSLDLKAGAGIITGAIDVSTSITTTSQNETHSASIQAMGDIQTGNVTAQDVIAVFGAQALTTGSLNATDILGLAHGAQTLGPITASGRVLLADNSMGALGVSPSAPFGYDVNLVFAAAPVRNAGAISLTGPVSAQGLFSAATQASFSVPSIAVAAGPLAIDAGGAISTGGLSATSSLTVGSDNGPIQVGNVTSPGGSVNLFTQVAGDISVGAITAGSAQLASAGNLLGGDISTSNGPIIVRTGGNAGLGTLSSAGFVNVNSGGSIDTLGITTSSNVVLAGGLNGVAPVTVSGDITASDIFLSSAGTISAGNLTATAASSPSSSGAYQVFVLGDAGVSVGTVTADDLVIMRSSQSIASASIDSGAGVGLFATGDITSGPINVSGNLILADQAMYTLGDFDTGYDLNFVFNQARINGAGNYSVSKINADGFKAGTFGSVNIGNIAANSLVDVFGGTSVTTGLIDAVGSVLLASGGDITTFDIGEALAPANISVTGNGSVTTGFVTGSGAVLLSGGTGLSTQDVFAGGDVTLSSASGPLNGTNVIGATVVANGGSVSLGSIQSSDFVVVSGGTISLGSIAAGGYVDISGGVIGISGPVDAGDTVDLNASGDISVLGAITAVADTTAVAGGAISLQDISVGIFNLSGSTQSANVGLSAGTSLQVGNVSTAGDIGLLANTTLTTGTLDGANMLVLAHGDIVTGAINASGRLLVADASMAALGGQIGANFNPGPVFAAPPVRTGGSITFSGPVNATVIQAQAGTDITAGNVTGLVVASLNAANNASVGNIDAGGVAVVVGQTGTVSVGNVTAGTTLNAQTPVNGHFVGLSAGGALTTGNLSSSEIVSISSRTSTITTGSLSAPQVAVLGSGDIAIQSISSTRNVRIDSIALQPLVTFSNGSLNLQGVFTADPVRTAGAISIATPVQAFDFQAAAGTTFTAPAISATGYLQINAGDVTVNTIDAGADALVVADNAIALGDVTSGTVLLSPIATDTHNVGLVAGGALQVGNISALDDIGLAANTITTGNLSATEMLILGHGAIATGGLAASGRVLIADQSMLSIGGTIGTNNSNFDPNLVFAATPVRTAGTVTIDGRLAPNSNAVTGSGLTVVSGGDVTVLGNLFGSGDALIDSAGGFGQFSGVIGLPSGSLMVLANGGVATQQVTVGGLNGALGSISIATTGAVSTGQLGATNGIGIVAGPSLTTTTVFTSAGNVSLASSGSIQTGNVSTNGGTTALLATGDVSTGAVGATSGLLIDAGGTVTATGALQSGTDLFVRGLTAINLGTVAASQATTIGDVALISNGAITTGTISGEDFVILAGGPVSTGVLTSRNRVTIADASLAPLGGTFGLGYNTNGPLGAQLVALPGTITIGGPVTTGGNFLIASQGNIAINGNAAIGGIFQGRGLLRSGGSITTGNLAAQGLLDVSGSGPVSTGNLSSVLSLTVAGGPSVTTGNVASSTGAVQMSSGGSLTAGAISAATTISLSASGAMTIGVLGGSTLDATGNITLIGGDILIMQGNQARSLQGAVSLISTGNVDTGVIAGQTGVAVTATGNINTGGHGANTGPVTLNAGGFVRTGQINSRGIVINAGTTFGSGNLDSSTDISITTGGQVFTSFLTASNAITVNAGGALSAGRLRTIGGNIVARSAGNMSVFAFQAGGSVDFASQGTFTATQQPTTAVGNILGRSVGAMTLANVTSSAGMVDLGAGGNLTTAAVSGTGVTLSGGPVLTTGPVAAVSGAVSLASTGTITTQAVSAGSSITISAPGTLTLGQAGGNTLDAVGAINLSGGDITIQQGNLARSTQSSVSLNSTGSVSALGGIVGQTTVNITATNNIDLGGLGTATGPVTLVAGGSVRTTGSNSRGLQVTAGTTFNSGNLFSSADISITTGGNIATAFLQTSAGSINIKSGGTLGYGQLRTAGGNIVVNSMGDVASGDLISTGTIDFTSAGAFTATKAFTAGGQVTGRATGVLSLANVTSTGGVIDLGSGGTMTTGALSGTGVTLSAGPVLTTGSVAATTGAVSLASTGTITTQAISAGSTITVNAPGALTLGQFGGNTLNAVGAISVSGGDITIQQGNQARSSQSSLTLTSTGNVSTGVVAGQTAVTINAAGNINSGGNGASPGVVTFTAGGSIITGGINAPGITLTAGTTFASANLFSSNGISITSGGNLATAAVQTSAGSITLNSGGTFSSGQLRSGGGNISLTAIGNTTVADLISTGTIDFSTQGTFTASKAFTAAGQINGQSGGALTLNNVTSTGAGISLVSGGALTTGLLSAATTLSLSTQGAFNVGSLGAGGNISISGVDLAMTQPVTSNGALSITASGALSTGQVSGATGVTLSGATSLTAGPISSGQGSVNLGSNGAITLGTVNAGQGIAITGPAAVSAGQLTSGAGTQVNGSNVTVGTISAGGTVALNATGALLLANVVPGGTTAAGITANGPVFLTAGTTLNAGQVFSNQALVGVAGGNLSLTSAIVNAGPGTIELASTGGSISVQLLRASNAVAAIANQSLTVGQAQGLELALLAGNSIQTGALSAGVVIDPVTGQITGATGRILLANSSQGALGGKFGIGTYNFNAVFNGTPVLASGTVTVNGTVNAGAFRSYSQGNMSAQAVNAFNALEVQSGGLVTVGQRWTSPDQTILSNDIDIQPSRAIQPTPTNPNPGNTTAGLNAGKTGDISLISSNANGQFVGDGLTVGSGYGLSGAEFALINSGSVVIASQDVAGNPVDQTIGNLAITGPQAGSTIDDPNGSVTFATGDVATRTPGTGGIKVVGAITAKGFLSTNTLSFLTGTVEMDVTKGSIVLTDSSGAAAGDISITADRIHFAEQSILDKLRVDPVYAGHVQDLNTPPVTPPTGPVISAAKLEFIPKQTFYIQNTGTQQVQAGFLVPTGGLTIEPSPAQNQTVSVTINGQFSNGGTTPNTTGQAAFSQFVQQDKLSNISSDSVFNNCDLTGTSCSGGLAEMPAAPGIQNSIQVLQTDSLPKPPIAADPPGDVTADVQTDAQSDAQGDPQSEEQKDSSAKEEQAEEKAAAAAKSPIAPPAPLVDTRPLNPSVRVDEPVAGSGNPALIDTIRPTQGGSQ